MQANQRKLRNALKINATFSTISGLLLIFDKPLIERMGIANDQIPMYIGIGLLIFAGLVFYQGYRKEIDKKQVKSIIVQDFAWVMASVVILIIQPWGLSELGYWLIGIVALIVGIFGLFQGKYLKVLS